MLMARNRVAIPGLFARPNPSFVPATILSNISGSDCARRVQSRREATSRSALANSARCFGLIDMRPGDVMPDLSFPVLLVERAAIVGNRSLSGAFAVPIAIGWVEKKSDSRRQDKSGSPPDGQAIGMAWLPASRSVGARAAPKQFANAIKLISGTVHDFKARGSRQ
jgi:hypothetical protein